MIRELREELVRIMVKNPDMDVIYYVDEKCSVLNCSCSCCTSFGVKIRRYVDSDSWPYENKTAFEHAVLFDDDDVFTELYEQTYAQTTRKSKENERSFCRRVGNIASSLFNGIKWREAIFVDVDGVVRI